uniref:Uncharacterized protein n=1 Tax=Cannabis sativa TaxID=3483 RepID=A0A803PY30_CANSA
MGMAQSTEFSLCCLRSRSGQVPCPDPTFLKPQSQVEARDISFLLQPAPGQESKPSRSYLGIWLWGRGPEPGPESLHPCPPCQVSKFGVLVQSRGSWVQKFSPGSQYWTSGIQRLLGPGSPKFS